MHTNRCRYARTKPEKCKCSCQGYLHGGGDDESIGPGEILMTESMGGEVGDFIRENKSKEYYCLGSHPGRNKVHTIDRFYGVEHEGGLKDRNGKGWWVFVVCPKGSGHQTSFTHLPGEINRATLEHKNSWEVEE